MAEDVFIGIGIFVMLLVLAMIGRTLGVAHTDIWS